MTTYGVYTKDLGASSISCLHSIEEAKKYCYGDRVVCSERQKISGWSIKFIFHGWTRMCFRYWKSEIDLGFLTLNYYVNKYSWADKIVYDPQTAAALDTTSSQPTPEGNK